jgi:glucose-6-phosphate isomerase
MSNIKLNSEKIYSFVSKEKVESFKANAMNANTALHKKTGKGNDFLGWVNLPSSITNEALADMQKVAASFKGNTDIMVVIGIGGSYLGAKAVIEALSGNFSQLESKREFPLVLFAGQNIGEDYLYELINLLKTKEWAITVISKSGTTTEPALAFRLLKKELEARYGKEKSKDRIVAITDARKGALRKLATQEGYKTYVIPDDVGGRFSVLTPVGLIPIAVAGFDIAKFVEGAKSMEALCNENSSFENNIAAQYAAARNALLQNGKLVEILANFDQRLNYISEWWKQLYGESEGKENKGIFPASVNFTADLHSMGQYIQEGARHIFETVVSVKQPKFNLSVPRENDDADELNYLAGKRIDEVNKMAGLGTLLAHVDGGVPNLQIELPQIDEFSLGQLLYFFEKACGISGYLLGVNPFDQPGVEAYKKNMFALLEKPGFEEQTKKIKLLLK